jgi:hypothetical protein
VLGHVGIDAGRDVVVDEPDLDTSTPCLRMIPALASTRPWVLLTSGLRLRVQLTKVALRPEKFVIGHAPTLAWPRYGGNGRVVTDR